MSIQANINQGLSLLGLLASQSPMAQAGRVKTEERARVKSAEKSITKLEKIRDQGDEDILAYVQGAEGMPLSAEQIKEEVPGYSTKIRAEKELANKYEQLAHLKPTEENLAGYNAALSSTQGYAHQAFENPKGYEFEYDKKFGGYGVRQVQKAKQKAAEALQVEAERIAATPSFDLDKLHPSARARVERAYKKAEHDTKYLNKKETDK